MIETVIALQISFGWPQLPPARFDHPYKPGVEIKWVDYPTVARLCQNIHAAACAFVHRGKKCTIVINAGYKGTWAEAALIRHERGHCEGWTAAHEQ